MTHKPSTKPEKTLAAHWRCDCRTVRRWRHDGAPLNDENAMRTWLAGRSKLPDGTARLLLEHKAKARAASLAIAADSKLPRGAAAALKRLESGEVTAYAALQTALKAGDAAEIKFARENWLRTGESLRKFDVAVALSRRDLGELVNKSEIADCLYWLGAHFQHWDRAVHEACPIITGMKEPMDIWAVFKNVKCAFLWDAIAGVRLFKEDFPDWIIDAFVKGLTGYSESAGKLAQTHLERFKEFLELRSHSAAFNARALIEKRNAALARYYATTDSAQREAIWKEINHE